MYDDDFKLCGAVQLMLVGRGKKSFLMRLVGRVNPLHPGKMQLSLIMGLTFCFFITFVLSFVLFYWGGVLIDLFTVKYFLLCLLCLSHCKKKSLKKEKKEEHF